MIKAILFDADNTLYGFPTKQYDMAAMQVLAGKSGESKQKLYREWEKIANKLKPSRNPNKRHRKYSYSIITKKYGVKNVNEMYNAFFKVMAAKVEAYAGAGKALKYLKKDYKLFVFTDDTRKQTQAKLKKTGLNKYFNQIVSSEDTGVMKPATKHFRMLMKRNNLKPSECIVIGDDYERDIVPAKKMGFRTIIFMKPKRKSDYRARSYRDVMKIIEKLSSNLSNKSKKS